MNVHVQAGGYGLHAGIIGGIGVFTGESCLVDCPRCPTTPAESRGRGDVTGCTITSNIALLAFYGAGGQQFLGGGVLVNTGVESIGAFGCGQYTPLGFVF